MIHSKDARVKMLCKDHIVKLGSVVYNREMKIAANLGHYNTSGGAFSKGIRASDLNV